MSLFFKFLEEMNFVLNSSNDSVLKKLCIVLIFVALISSSSKQKTLCKFIIFALVFFNIDRLEFKTFKELRLSVS